MQNINHDYKFNKRIQYFVLNAFFKICYIYQMRLSNFPTIIDGICQNLLHLLNTIIKIWYNYWMHFWNIAAIIERICHTLLQLLNAFVTLCYNYWTHSANFATIIEFNLQPILNHNCDMLQLLNWILSPSRNLFATNGLPYHILKHVINIYRNTYQLQITFVFYGAHHYKL